jgi:glycosyltransferase involved in cell wall biosynthesis
MNGTALSPIASPRGSCRLTVAIPARNEERLIQTTLEALATQTAMDGGLLRSELFDVIVFANNCSDGTAEAARAFAAAHPELAMSIVCGELPIGRAHVGMARKLVMDLATSRFIAAGKNRGLVATTDADTVVEPDWIANILLESKCVDAVAGHVTIAESDLATLLAPVRSLYARERAYRRALADAWSTFDPLSYDPAPRHASFVGASFAVASEIYVAAGGVPAVPVLEDRGFFEALCRIDARVRHSLRVRARTSGRRIGRVDGGFGSFVDELHVRGASGETFFVEHPRSTLDEIEVRAIFRRIWDGSADVREIESLNQILTGPPPLASFGMLDRSGRFGSAYEHARRMLSFRRYEPVPVECATEALRAAIAVLKAPSATRITAASGAG